jgi:phosphatidylglycerol:prolipoprotein diacylglycerol transferase
VKPVLFELGNLEVTSYGVSKALAILVAGFLLARELRRAGRDTELSWPLTFAGAVGGFAGAKLYYLLENAGNLSSADLGGTGSPGTEG